MDPTGRTRGSTGRAKFAEQFAAVLAIPSDAAPLVVGIAEAAARLLLAPGAAWTPAALADLAVCALLPPRSVP
jgi:hypothetical protein